MNCLNISLPSINKNLEDLTDIVGDKEVAYAALASNNGYNMEQTDTGKVSKLFTDLENIVTDKDIATVLKMRVHSPEFIDKFGSGLNRGIIDVNNEPKLFSRENLHYYIGKSESKIDANVPVFQSKSIIDKQKQSNSKDAITKLQQELDNELQKKTESKFAKSIFPDTKVDEIVYHATMSGEFNKFDKRKIGKQNGGWGAFGKGFYFSDTSDAALKHIFIFRGGEKRVIKVILNITNPKKENNYTVEINDSGSEYTDSILKNGKDGIIAKYKKGIAEMYSDEYVVFEPSQIHILTDQELSQIRDEKKIKELQNKIEELSNNKDVDIREINKIPSQEKENIFLHAESDADLAGIYSDIQVDISNGISTFFVVPSNLANSFDIEISEYLNSLGWKYKTKNGVHYFTKPIKEYDVPIKNVSDYSTTGITESTKFTLNKKRELFKIEATSIEIYGYKINIEGQNNTNLIATQYDMHGNKVSGWQILDTITGAKIILLDFYINDGNASVKNEILDSIKSTLIKHSSMAGNRIILETIGFTFQSRSELANPELLVSNKNPNTITDSKGVQHQKGSVAALAVQFMHSIGRNATQFLFQDNSTIKQKALQKAIPGAYTFEYNSIPEIAQANEYLEQNLVTSVNDPRLIPYKGDIDLYNKLIYDVYQEAIHRAIVLNSEGFNENVAFQLRVDHVRADLESSLDALHTRKINMQNSGASNKVINEIDQIIVEKEELLKFSDDEFTIKTIKNIAKADLTRVEKIVAKAKISTEELNQGQSILDTWISAGDFSNIASHIFLDPSEAGEEAIQEDFYAISIEAQKIKNSLDLKGRKLLENRISRNLKDKFKFNDLVQLKNKINGWFKTVYSIAKIDNPIIAHIMSLINKANKDAEIQAITESNKLASLYKILKDKNFGFDVFWQKDKNGITTTKLISEYTNEYLTTLSNFKRDKSSRYSIKNYRKDNIFIDLTKVAGVSDSAKEAYIQEISPFIGYDKAVSAVQEALELFEQYKEIKNNFILAEFGKTEQEIEEGSEEAEILFNWKILNSPAARLLSIKRMPDAAKYSDIQAELGAKFIVTIPKKTDSEGNSTKLYDQAFEEITQDPDASKFYKVALNITKKAKENFGTDNMSENSLGSVSNTMMEEFSQRGIKDFTSKVLWDEAMGYLAGKEGYDMKKDPVTGKEIKTLTKGIVTLDHLVQSEVFSIYEEMGITKESLRALPETEKTAIYKRASETVMSENSTDIYKALNALNFASLSYGFKSAIKPEVDMAMHYLDQIEAGVSNETLSFNDVGIADVANAREMTEYFVDRTFFDIGNEDNSYKLPLKLYTKKEKIERKKLIEQLKIINSGSNKLDGKTTASKIDVRLKSLGRNLTVNSALKSVMDFLRISTMGWNFQSALANLFQGQIVNIINAAEGKLYTFETLKGAYSSLFSEREKFNNLIKNYSLLGDIMYNFERKTPFEKVGGVFDKIKKIANPYEGTKVTEKMNQGVLMIAMLMHATVDGPNGKVTMWEAIDKEGKLPNSFTYENSVGEKGLTDMILKLREQINLIQGDYTNPKVLQKTIVGRAASMFHLWFFEPFHARFGSEKYNHILKIKTRGRYLSGMDILSKYKLNYAQFIKDTKSGKVTELDYNNMKVNLMELSAIAAMGLMSLLAKALFCDDKESKCGGVVTTYTVNFLNRLNGEVSTFVNPKQYYDLISNPVAVARYLKSIDKMFNYMTDAASGKDMDNADDENKILVAAGKEIPLIRRILIERDLISNVRSY